MHKAMPKSTGSAPIGEKLANSAKQDTRNAKRSPILPGLLTTLLGIPVVVIGAMK